MDPDYLATSTKNVPRKVKFAPTGPPRRAKKTVTPKVEKVEDDPDAAAQAQELLRRFNESALKLKPKAERKGGPTPVAFGYAGSSPSLKSCSGSPGVNNYDSPYPNDGGAGNRPKKEYKEPWDYYSHYPTALPLRRPYSGDPEVLDEEEFGEGVEALSYDEGSTKAGMELGLMGENMEERMLFFQLPARMPMVKEQPNAGSNETSKNSKSSTGVGTRQKLYNLHELPSGFMGKLLVYRSGDVKLKLGDNLFDVSEGVDITSTQEIFAVNTEEKLCCSIGELSKCAVVTPDVDHILDGMLDM